MTRATSLYLDLIRPAAACVVMLSHVHFMSISGGQLTVLRLAGVQAVDIFFVLSGFVIAHVCATREQTVRSYFESRAARIYSVAVPALLLTALADFIGLRLDADTYDAPFQPFSPGLLVRSIFFLGEQWQAHRLPGSNGPYWSLGFEVWYYVAFGAFIFAPRRWRWVAAGLVLLFIGPKVAILFPIWLMGVVTYRFCRDRQISPRIGWILFSVPIVAIAVSQTLPHSMLFAFLPLSLDWSRLLSTCQDDFIGAMFSLHLIGVASVSHVFLGWLDRGSVSIRWIAGASFSLYLGHLPIMFLISAASPWPKSSTATLTLLIIGTPLACLLFAEVSERRKDVWRRLIDKGLRLTVRRCVPVQPRLP